MMMTKELREYLVPDIDMINSSYLDSILLEIKGSGEEVLVNHNMLFDGLDDDIDDNSPSDTDKSGLWDE